MHKQILDGSWKLAFTLPDTEKTVETVVDVPCNVEQYLVRMGLIEDIFPADDPYATQAFDFVDDWTYTKTFEPLFTSNETKKELVFEGIDTIAEIYLNGEKLLDCQNMHRAYRADVSDRLVAGENELKVVIRSGELWARDRLHNMISGGRSALTTYNSQTYLRKARHQWGWDNAPRLLTSGIIRSVYLEEIPQKRFEDVYLYTESIGANAVNLAVAWSYKTNLQSLCNHCFRLSLLDGDQMLYEQTKKANFVQGIFRYSIPRDQIELWWPSGFGNAKLYTVKLEMMEGDQVVATYTSPFGIRTLVLDWTEDITEENGGEFVFRINGERIFIRGTNWKPLDPMASLADQKTKTGKALDEIKALGCNMVRIWGGGIYEDPYFFEYCDQNGIMVWQDFMFACEVPAMDDDFCAEVEKEAIDIVKKYRNHPSLAVWCGDNENDECMMWLNKNNRALPSDSVITRRVLNKVTLELDPYRSYVPSSPFASDLNAKERKKGQPILHVQPETHLYPSVLDQPKALRECKSFFLGETGPIEVNAMTVNETILLREAGRAKRLWNEPVPTLSYKENCNHQFDYYFMRWRQTGKQICEHFYGRDFSFEEIKDYTLAINVRCAEVFKDIIEYCRVNRWSKTGVLWWSLMDMFPMLFNYSVIDCDYNRKLPFYWIQKSQQAFALMGVRQEADGEISLYAANDTLLPHTAEYTVTAYDEALEAKTVAVGSCTLEKNSAKMIHKIANGDRPSLWIIKWVENGKTYFNHVFTKPTTYEITKKWVEIIGRETGLSDELLELKYLQD